MLNLNPTLTAAGLALFTGQSDPGFNVAITHIAFGSQKYDPLGTETALKTEIARFPVDGAALISPSSIQVGVLMTALDPQSKSADDKWIGEIGFYVGSTLFAVLSTAASYLFYKSPDIDIPVTYVLDFSVLPPGSITVDNTQLSASIALASQYATTAAQSAQNHAEVARGLADSVAADLSGYVSDYAALRSYSGVVKRIYVTGVLGTAKPSGIAGDFIRDDSDTTSAENGGTIIVASNGKRWRRVVGDAIHLKWFGAIGDGIANDTAAVLAAITEANLKSIQIDLTGGTYKVDSAALTGGKLTLPKAGFVGRGRITGAPCLWYQVKNVVTDGEFRCDSLELDSIWYANFGRLRVDGNVTLSSSSVSWGTFWNTFQHIECTGTLIIDVDKGQSVNQNVFGSVSAKGGLHIKGVATSGIREAHNNLFLMLDTTGANLTATDGTTGYHVLNDSVRSQYNTIQNWYAEGTGSRTIRGNWHVMGSVVDSSLTHIQVGRHSHYMNASQGSRNGDFFAGSVVNRSRGGEWAQFDALGIPLGIGLTGGMGRAIVAATNAPDGNPLALQCTATSTHQLIAFNFPLSSSAKVELTAFIQIENLTVNTASIYRGSGDFFANFSLVDVGNGWSLLRVAGEGGYLGDGSGATAGYVRISLTGSALPSPAPVYRLGSWFLSHEQTAFLPQYKQGPKEAFGTTAPTAGIWSVGDRWWHTAPVAGGVPGGLCVAAGSPGTWKSMPALGA